jgi:imidazolonepropionase-like amidohydrolase
MRNVGLRFGYACAIAAAAAAAGTSVPLVARQGVTARAPEHARRPARLLIANAMVIYGNAKPPFGPVDVLVENGLIARIGTNLRQGGPGGEAPVAPDAVIDATGKYVMPGMVNTHMHWHEERQAGIPQPIQYERNLYLATGTTTAREVGGNTQKTKQWREESRAGTIVAPRILLWNRPNLGRNRTPDEIRAGVRQAKADGYDGLKIGGLDRDQLEALLDEAREQGLCTTTHIGVEETTAKDYVDLGVCSIEHFYGVADAALEGVQDFPPEHNANNEIHRFGRAGELYTQANRDALMTFVEYMAAKGVGWSPTMSIYEASRDIVRSQNLPWYKDYLHPSMEAYWQPSLLNHGSYFGGWTTAHEARWKRSYRVWMDALVHFARRGGLVTTGDDAGYIWSLYGFGMLRELELHEEAGFHPLEVIEHATVNGARMVGLADRLGRVRQGYLADLLVVNGNPLENLRLLNPYGTDIMTFEGRPVSSYAPVAPDDPRVKFTRGGGIEWTIKDGIPYHVPTLMREVRDMVARARAQHGGRQTASP